MQTIRKTLVIFAVGTTSLYAGRPLVASGGDMNDNPFTKSKVGDYLFYKITTSVMGNNTEATMKQTVSAVSDKELSFKTIAIVDRTNIPVRTETKIDLTKPYDPVTATMQTKGKFEKAGAGKEKIKVGDKIYECHWISGKLVVDAFGNNLDFDVKAWFAKSVPMSGLVKMEMKSKTTMELTESGHEK